MYGKDGKSLSIGDEYFVWEDEDKINEFIERREKAKTEIKSLESGKRWILFLLKRGYNTPYSINTRVQYKQTIKKFRTDGSPIYRPHYLTVNAGRIKTSNSEEIAFLDMSDDFIRETDRPLTQAEKNQMKVIELENKVKALEARRTETEPQVETQAKENIKVDKKVSKKKVKDEVTKTKG